MSTAAALLAAGHGSRFTGNRHKPLALLHHRPLAAWAIDAAVESGLQPVLLVVGAHSRNVAQLAPSGVEVVDAPHWELGIAHSVHALLDALEPRVSVRAVCIGLADQPNVGAEAFTRLARAHDEGAELAVATYDGVRGNPVLLGRSLWAEARTLQGDVGARALMSTHAPVEVDCSDTGSPRDVDTLDDLHALEEENNQP
ncbi:MAG: nucleotidyltransferase family protein [Acidimicrobiia bacterium]|nr:nucleotidyltransferase family protein [Acidimicrobiia bacterium]